MGRMTAWPLVCALFETCSLDESLDPWPEVVRCSDEASVFVRFTESGDCCRVHFYLASILRLIWRWSCDDAEHPAGRRRPCCVSFAFWASQGSRRRRCASANWKRQVDGKFGLGRNERENEETSNTCRRDPNLQEEPGIISFRPSVPCLPPVYPCWFGSSLQRIFRLNRMIGHSYLGGWAINTFLFLKGLLCCQQQSCSGWKHGLLARLTCAPLAYPPNFSSALPSQAPWLFELTSAFLVNRFLTSSQLQFANTRPIHQDVLCGPGNQHIHCCIRVPYAANTATALSPPLDSSQLLQP